MQKHIIPVLISFFSVILIILLGTHIAYRTNIIPDMQNELQEAFRRQEEQDKRIENLENELDIAQQKQNEAEEKLKVKLAEEEQIVLEKAQKEQEARIAAQQAAAAEAARIAAEQKESSSKESKAS